MVNMFVRDIMQSDIVSLSQDSSVREAAWKMKLENVGTIAVLDKDRLVGLLNDRQIVLNVVAPGGNPDKMRVREVMTKNPDTCAPDTDLFQASEIMAKKHYRRLPIVDDQGRLQGIISVTDLGQALKCCLDNVLDEPCKREKGIAVSLKR
jgi:CBS domain-containing protein